jgi:hypothetical protein
MPPPHVKDGVQVNERGRVCTVAGTVAHACDNTGPWGLNTLDPSAQPSKHCSSWCARKHVHTSHLSYAVHDAHADPCTVQLGMQSGSPRLQLLPHYQHTKVQQ